MGADEGRASHLSDSSCYIFDNAGTPARARVDSLSALYDPATIALLQARGVGVGWSCLEIGAGNGSIAGWLADCVGPTGYVLATDIDTRFCAERAQAHLEVRRHNIVTDALPKATFDLIHTRLVLHHLPGRDRALEQIVQALKPGGWVVLEEFDTISLAPVSAIDGPESVWKVQDVMLQLMQRQGVDRHYGRRLPALLREHGLADVGVHGSFTLWHGRTPSAYLQRANYDQLRDAMLDSGLITREELDQDLARLDDPDSVLLSPVMWAVWGRHP